MVNDEDVSFALTSCYTDEGKTTTQFHNLPNIIAMIGVMDVRNHACDKLLAARVEQKLKGTKIQNVINKLHLAQPVARDDKQRPAFIPEAALSKRKFDQEDPMRPKLAKEIEQENGGAGVFNVDLKASYLLKDQEWKYDKIPEIMDGKNVADFIDPEIQEKLEALEREEERLIAAGFYDSDDEMDDDETAAIKEAAVALKAKKDIIIQKHREGKGRNKPALPKKVLARVSSFELISRFNITRRLIMHSRPFRLLDWMISKATCKLSETRGLLTAYGPNLLAG